ncbi:MAG TPA: radical SAM protein [Clostridia bacterium]|nr:radical SAM protein [Clostridia bacterium]
MGYKKSFYNIEIETLGDGRKLIYNTYSGIYGVMDKKTQAAYYDIENIDVESIHDSELQKAIEIMVNSGYLVHSDKDELGTLKLERSRAKYHDDTLRLTIAPTMDCNMCCPYCYENKNSLVMSKKLQEQTVAFIEAHLNAYPNIKSIGITWYGGEPLMQKEIIYSLSEKIIYLCKARNMDYSANIITNGSLLDAETSKRLVEDCMVGHAQITIDGMPELHNRRRILIDGSDSHQIIMQNIAACKDILPISVRINVDKENMGEIDELIRYFLEEKKWIDNPGFYLAPVEDHSEVCTIEKSSCLQDVQFAEINTKYLRANYAFNRDNVAKEFFPRRRAVFCGSECVQTYVIDPEGYLYTCWLHVGNKARNCGHVGQPFIINSEYAKWLAAGLHEKCEACQYLPMCQGGCANFRVGGDGEPHCVHTLYSYKDKLKLAYEDYILQKSKPTAAAEK